MVTTIRTVAAMSAVTRMEPPHWPETNLMPRSPDSTPRTRHARTFSTTAAAVLLCTAVAFAQGTKTVEVTGEGVTTEAALKAALRAALEKGAGAQLASYSRTENFELVRDTVFSRSEGLVSSYDILQQGPGAGGIFFCEIRAQVSSDAVASAWGQVQNVLSQIGRPKVMVYIAETIDREPQTSSILESKIEERLIDLGFDVYDSSHLDAIQRREADHAVRTGDDAKMRALAKNFSTQVFIMGNANADGAENTSVHGVNLIMYNCDVQVKAYYTDTGKLLASKALPNIRGGARGHRTFSPQAGKMAIVNGSGPLIDEMYATVMSSWSYQISGGGEVRVEVSGIASASQAYKLKKAFAAIPNVDSVTGPDLSEGTAVFTLKAKMTAQDMMEFLIEPERAAKITVDDVTLNRNQAHIAGK